MISSGSKKKALVVLSTTKEKHKATLGATCKAMWLHQILCGLKLPQMQPTTLHCNNQSAIKMTKDPIYHSKTKSV